MSKTPLHRIYTSDYSAVGYCDAVANGKQGKPKSYGQTQKLFRVEIPQKRQ